ncbi:MAG: serine/threonine-protein kinase, partial [Planctomycetota bacterium]
MNQPVKYRHESGCPSRDDLQALLMGSLGDLHEQSIESHVATCEKCGQTLEDLCQNDDVDRWQKLAQDSSDSFTETPAKHSGNKKSSRTDLDNAPAIDGYEMLEVAGRGGMGIVYKARQKSLNRIVAIKTLHSNAPDDWQRIERFKKEADSIARIKHANVVSIYEINDHDGAPYLVLEYIDGPDLGRLIKRQAPFDNFSAAQLVYKLAIAIDAAHRQGLLHRDLKPANILLQVSENCPGDHIRLKDCEPKVTDFGLAKNFEYDDKTRTSMLVG